MTRFLKLDMDNRWVTRLLNLNIEVQGVKLNCSHKVWIKNIYVLRLKHIERDKDQFINI